VISDSVHDIYQGAQPTHPCVEARHRVLGTYKRIQHLERGLDLAPGTFLEWQKLQCKDWYDELYPAAANNTIDKNDMGLDNHNLLGNKSKSKPNLVLDYQIK
jgi:hypothetical protein